jgi:hypothetical protein
MGIVQEAEMAGRNIYSQKGQAIVEVSMIGIALLLASGSCKVAGMAREACELADSTHSAVLLVLRCILLLADCRGTLAYLYDNAGLLQHLPKTLASLWPLLWALVRQAQ